MSGLATRLLYQLHDLDPRDRRHAIWVLSPDMYEQLDREYTGTIFPAPELVDISKAPSAERPAMIFGIEVWVRYDLPPGTATLDVDDPVTRAIKRTRQREGDRVTVNLVKVDPLPFEVAFPRPPEITLRALVRKWIKRGRS